MMTSTSATDAISMPFVDMLDLHEEIFSLIDEVKKLHENGGEPP